MSSSMRNGKEAMTAVMATTKDLIGSCVKFWQRMYAGNFLSFYIAGSVHPIYSGIVLLRYNPSTYGTGFSKNIIDARSRCEYRYQFRTSFLVPSVSWNDQAFFLVVTCRFIAHCTPSVLDLICCNTIPDPSADCQRT